MKCTQNKYQSLKIRKRWYDKDRKLREYLDGLRHLPTRLRTTIIENAIAIVRVHNSELVDNLGPIHFPLNILCRRWYDKDPLLWLFFNALKSADKDLIKKIKEYFKTLVCFQKT